VCYDLLGTFCANEEVFLFLCTEGSFVLLRTGDMATVVDIRTSQSCDNATVDGNGLQHGDIVATWNATLSQIMEFTAVKCWLVVQQGCKCLILAPLHWFWNITTVENNSGVHLLKS